MAAFVLRICWCPDCAAEKEQIRTPDGMVCRICYTVSDGRHPSEKSDVVLAEHSAGLELIRKNINRQRVFPRTDTHDRFRGLR